MSDKKILKVTIRDIQHIIFEGDADRISSYNEMGRFDVFPKHANFISIIRQELKLYQHNKEIKSISIDQAVMKVKQDNVHIFLGIEALFLEPDSPKTEQKK